MKPFVELNALSFRYPGSDTLFFEDLSLHIEQPGLIFVVGKNGVGKSTFFRLMQGIAIAGSKVSGTLNLFDKSYDLAISAERKSLWYDSMLLLQSFDQMLVPHFTGYENISFAQFDEYPSMSLYRKTKSISSLIAQFGVPMNKPVYQLSGGQRQILATTMVLQKDIKLLLLDEPTAALDQKNSSLLMRYIQTVAYERNLAVFCVSHDQELVETFADYTLHIAQDPLGQRSFEVKKNLSKHHQVTE